MKTIIPAVVSMGWLMAAGCTQEAPGRAAPRSSEPPVVGSKFLLQEEPSGADDVIAVRNAAANGDEVLVVGRIGGGNPWIEDRAAFSIVDTSLKACSDIPGDACQTPWDYCCETDKLPTSTALVKIVDENDELIGIDARGLLNVQELSTVVVQGKAQRDDAGNLTVLTRRVYVRK